MPGRRSLEERRLEALRQYEVLDSQPEKIFDDLVNTAAQICRTPLASIGFIDDKRHWFKARYGFQDQEVDRERTFCRYTIQSTRPLIVPNTLQDPRFSNHPVVTGSPFVRFYAGVPLISQESYILGTLCVVDLTPRLLTQTQISMLEALARQATAYLDFRRNHSKAEKTQDDLQHAISSLMRAHARNDQQRERLAQSEKMALLGEMASEIIHEINNPLAVVQLKAAEIKDLATIGSKPSSGEISSVCDDIESTISKIAKIMRSVQSFGRGSESDPLQQSSVNQVVEDVFCLFKKHIEKKGIKLTFHCEKRRLALLCRETQIFQVVVNLVHNAADAVEKLSEKWIRLEAKDLGTQIEISVTDSGSGIPAEVSSNLFRSYFTTKPAGGGTGLGLVISRRIAQSHEGSLEYDPKAPNTRFVLTLPKKPGAAGGSIKNAA